MKEKQSSKTRGRLRQNTGVPIQNMADDRDDLRCCVCLDFFKNPAIIPCGHIFCKDCITGLWYKDVRRCPQCKQTFPNKPVVTDWLQMKELSEKLLKMRPKEEDDEDAEAHEVSCDSCTSRRTKAVQSCLTCVSSFCRNHLEKHNDLHGWKKHLDCSVLYQFANIMGTLLNVL
uniref:RING-type domain-containing protein n=1 Tax=Sinocyclocheilus rhinocerous TaxID=307959 RepID=A0A673IKN2_9TELE